MKVTMEELRKYAFAGALAQRSRLASDLAEVNDFLERLNRPDKANPIVPGQEPVAEQPVAQPATKKAKEAKKPGKAPKTTDNSAEARAERIANAWSPAKRKAVSDRMKRYWAMRRAAKQQPATPGAKGKKNIKKTR